MAVHWGGRGPGHVSRGGGLFASLRLDFLNNVSAIDPRITFTRASSATRVNSSGLIETVSSNVARFDYDPVTLAPKGLLIEEQRTNLATYSSAVGGTNWNSTISGTGVAPVIAINSATAPDGTQTASRLQFSLGGGTATADSSLVTQVLTGVSCRGSYYVKTNDGTTKTIYVRGNIAASIVVDGTWRRYDFDAGTLVGSQFGIGLRGGQGTTNSDTADLLVWGAQIEAGAFATSYIPTTSATVTRAADVASITGTNFSDWYNPAEGTFVVEYNTAFSGLAAATSYILCLDGSSSKRIVYISTGSDVAATYDGSTIIGATGDVTGSAAKTAMAYSVSGRAIASNGNAVSSGAVAAGFSAGTSLFIGTDGASPVNGHIRRLTYYPTRLSNALLQSLTA